MNNSMTYIKNMKIKYSSSLKTIYIIICIVVVSAILHRFFKKVYNLYNVFNSNTKENLTIDEEEGDNKNILDLSGNIVESDPLNITDLSGNIVESDPLNIITDLSGNIVESDPNITDLSGNIV